MATSVWKGYLTFGLISIPVRLYSAARSAKVQLHQLHKPCSTRIKQPLFCPTCNRIVDRSEIIKGYEYEKGRYVLVEDEEIKQIAPPSSRNMEILTFVRQSQIDPLYYEQSYFAVPEEPGRKPYQLLFKSLEDSERVGIAKMAMHQREYTVFIRPRKGGLTLHTMYFANEIRELAEYGKTRDIKLKPQEIKLAQQLIDNLAADFKLEDYRDEYQDRLRALLDAKLKGKEITRAPQPHVAPVIDMMEALKKSLAATSATPKRPPGRAVSAKSERVARKKAG